MNRLSAMFMTLLVILTLGVVHPVVFQRASSQPVAQPNRILERNADILTGRATPRPKEMLVSSGTMNAYMEARAARGGAGAGFAQSSSSGGGGGVGVSRDTLGCSNEFPGQFKNIRVNQDCTLRRQAEEAVAINPLDPDNILVGQNDSRVGFNHCGVDFSLNRGKRWGDELPPFYQFLMLDGRSPDACSDPTLAFDSRGNAYFGGILFNVLAAPSALVVTKSNAANKGTFWHSPAPVAFQEYSANPLGVVANDNNPAIFHDKELMTADSNPSSPKRDNVYMTWTRFTLTNSPIYFSQSTNGGATWSTPIEISGSNAAICTIFSGTPGDPNRCDQDQGSHPFVAPNGDIHVVFGNGNTPLVGINQVLHVSCPVAANCAVAASWTAPTKVSDLIDNHPTGPSLAGCPGGRQCLPPNGYRVPEFTSMTGNVDPANPNRLYVTLADFRNGGPPCTGPAATATPPCDNDVFLAVSNNGGATWGTTKRITPAGTAQWQPWSAVGPDGVLYVAYYDRQYGNCEFTGCNDITLAATANPGATTPTFHYFRITTASMPNLTPANNPVQAGFLGDYMWVAADRKGVVIVWADTRPRPGRTTPEEDIYFAHFERTIR